MKPTSSSLAQVKIGSFELDIQAGELHRGGFTVRLQEQPREILAMLLEHPGDVVTREELRRRLWPDHTFIDFEHGLNRAINKLREALEDDAKEPQYIETLPRRGYRLVASVEPVRALPSSANGELSSRPVMARTPPSLQEAGTHQMRWRAVVVAMLGINMTAIVAFWYATHLAHPKPELKQRRLTANPVEYPVSGAAISPDGKYLAYSDPAGIHVKLIETGETHTVTPRTSPRPEGSQAGESAPSKAAWAVADWFPDRTRLLANLGEEEGWSIWTLSILGGSPRKLREGARAYSVSPDGSLITFTTGSTPALPFGDLWVMGPEGGGARRVATPSEGSRFYEANWSPDGHRLATRTWGSRCAIETHDLTGSNPVLVLTSPSLCQGLVSVWWLPDGRLIYPQAEPPPDQDDDNLWEIRVDPRTGEPAGAPQRITNWEDSGLEGLSATADGKRLLLLKVRAQEDVYVSEIEARGRRLKTPRRLTMDEHSDLPCAWTPDGKAVLFASNRTGRWNIFKQALDEDTAEPLTTDSEFHWGINSLLHGVGPHFSPDGKWVVYSAASKEEDAESTSASRRLMRMPAAGGPSQFVLEGQGFLANRCAQAPATLCVVGEMSADRKQLVLAAFDPAKGRGRELVRITPRLQPESVSWDLSPDGSRIAYTESDDQEGRIHFVSLAGGALPNLVVRSCYGFSALAWAADSKGLFVTSTGVNATRIFYVDLQGHAYPLWEHQGSWISCPVPSPDGRHLAILGPTGDSNAWMLENF